ncbi:hypothetical protein ACT80S_18465 [Ramlibacter sp. MAHUQ-53]|uniref:hypothetical protein n=1 Tax=unclassified Ramlibacter TaxID=2617605 RepID=UPI0036351B0F
MKRDFADYHYVPAEQVAVHERLTNWARYVAVRWAPTQAPIWRLGKSNSRQWHQPEPKTDIDAIDAMKIERAVRELPMIQREVLRWAYVHRNGPIQIRKRLGLTADALLHVLLTGRLMLINRSV